MPVNPNDLYVSTDFRFVGGRLEKVTGDLKPVDANDLANYGPLFIASIVAAGVRQLVAADFGGRPFDSTELFVPIGITGPDVRLPADAANGCVAGARINVIKPPGSSYGYTLSSPTHGILVPGGTVVTTLAIPATVDPSSWELTFDSVLAAWRVLSLQNGSASVWERILADLSVSTAKLQDNAITTIKIAALQVTTAKLAAGAVTPSKCSPLRRELLISATGVSSGTELGLTADTTIGTWPAVTSGLRQEVPEAGKYRVQAFMNITTTSTVNPTTRAAELYVNAVATGRQLCRGTRWNATAADEFQLSPILDQTITIATPASERLSLSPTSGTWSTAAPTTNRFVIEKVSD